MNGETYRIVHDAQSRRFKLMLNDVEASHVIYEVRGDTIVIVSTYTQPQYRGKGLAARLMQAIARFAEERGLSIKPVCSYAIHFFKNRPEYKHIVQW